MKRCTAHTMLPTVLSAVEPAVEQPSGCCELGTTQDTQQDSVEPMHSQAGSCNFTAHHQMTGFSRLCMVQEPTCRGPDSMTITSWGCPGPGCDRHHMGGANGTSVEDPNPSLIPAARIFQLALAALLGASWTSVLARLQSVWQTIPGSRCIGQKPNG